MIVDSHDAIAILQPIGLALGRPKRAALELNEAWAPYAQGTLVYPMPDDTTRAQIRANKDVLRVDLRLRRDFARPWSVADVTAAGGGTVAGLTTLLGGGTVANLTRRFYKAYNIGAARPAQQRNCDLMVTLPDFDDGARELTLTVQGNEARLQGDINTSTAPLDPSSLDLRIICAWLLARYGWTLSDGPATATVAEADATLWQPGVSADDYVNPMLEAASLRLWCDETGVWSLEARQSLKTGTAAFSLVTALDDQLSQDPNVAPDAIVVKYTWTDATGANHVEYDADGASPSRRGLLVERATIYPGPGAAAGLLTRAQGRGRVASLSHVNDLDMTPGQSCTVRPLDGSILSGYLSSVAWNYPDAEGPIDTRGLVDVAPDTWLAGASYNVTSNDVHANHPTLAANAFTDWSQVL